MRQTLLLTLLALTLSGCATRALWEDDVVMRTHSTRLENGQVEVYETTRVDAADVAARVLLTPLALAVDALVGGAYDAARRNAILENY